MYAIVNVGFVFLVVILSAAGPAQDPRTLYLCLLFALCSTPLLLARSLHGPYAILWFLMPILFVFYGVADLGALLIAGPPRLPQGDILSTTELVILSGIGAVVLGYRAVQTSGVRPRSTQASDWPPALLVGAGLAFWASGTAVYWYWNIYLIVRAAEFHNVHSPLVTAGLLMAKLMQPVGILILAYAQIRLRSKTLMLLLIAIAAFQVVYGFASNTKSGAMMGAILIITASVLVRGRVPVGWLAAVVAFVLFAFPVFQAYRISVVGEQGATNAQTAGDIGAALRMTLDSMRSKKRNPYGEGLVAESFLQRSSMKPSVDMIVRRTGSDVAYQHGYTLIPMLTAFIPRFIWPTKLDVQAGQLLNRQFRVSEGENTYISPSHLGEMYWNFGVPGVIVGMLLLGVFLGGVNRACDLSQQMSVTRLLVLAITIQQTVVRFEGTIASEYSVWMRSVAAVLLLHLLIARPPRIAPAPRSGIAPTKAPTLGVALPPNLMR